MKFRIPLLSALILTALLPQTSFAQLYYDTNGSTGGTSVSSTQNFTDSVWTTDATGSSTTTGYTPGSDVVFSATDGISIGTGTQNVTVTDSESANSFTFNNGTVTLFGSGSPNLSIGAGGVAVNSTDGATTFDSSLGTVTVGASQSWNNNSTQAFNVNSGVTGSSSTLSFGGTGTGNVNVNGAISGNMNLTQNSTMSALYLNNGGNSFTGTISANGGVIVAATEGALGNGGNVIDLSNGGTIGFNNTMSYNAWTNNIVLGTGGGSIAAGDPNGAGIDVIYSGTVTGHQALNIVKGDFLPTGGSGYDVSSINVSNAGTRLLTLGNAVFGNGTAPVNVGTAATLDFAAGGTINNPINLADGSALENRSGGVTLGNVVMPATGTVTVGADDVGGGSISINSGINLTGSLTLDVNENHVSSPGSADTTVYLNGNITGSGALTLTLIPGVYNEGTVALGGNNTYNGPTTLNGVTVYPEGSGFGSSNVTMNSATVNLTGGTLSNPFTVGTGTSVMNLVSGAGPQTVSGQIEMAVAGDSLFVKNSSTSNLTVGSIKFDPLANPDHAVLFDDYNTGSITLNGTYTSDNAAPPQGGEGASTLVFGELSGNGAANYNLSSTADFSQMEPYDVHGVAAIELFAGNLNIANSTFVPGQFISVQNNPGVNHTINVVGAQTINANVYVNLNTYPNNIQTPTGGWTLNQSTAATSHWTGNIQHDSQDFTASAVAGGRLIIDGPMTGYVTDGMVKSGAGTVVLSSSGNNYGIGGSVAMDVQQGTLLITNTAGSAFGSNGGTVQVESGARLGGSGISTQQVVAVAGGIIAPGDSGADGGTASIDTLHLTGGLSMASGAVMAFKLNGAPGANDMLDLGAGALTLTGTTNVDFTGTLNVSVLGNTNYYTLATGTGDWTTNPTFNFSTPAGYAVDHVIYDPSSPTHVFEVNFALVPEPSTYALMIGGLALLAFCVRRKNRMGNL